MRELISLSDGRPEEKCEVPVRADFIVQGRYFVKLVCLFFFSASLLLYLSVVFVSFVYKQSSEFKLGVLKKVFCDRLNYFAIELSKQKVDVAGQVPTFWN